MKLYKYNYFANFKQYQGEIWAADKYDVERHIVSINFNATGINIWVM